MHSQGRCRRGRASLVAASLLAIVVCAVLLFWCDSGAPPEKSAPPVPAAPAEGVDTAGSGDATGAPAAPVASAPGREGAQRARVFGTVSDKDGTPLGGMHVRWVPESAKTLEDWIHDANAFSETGGTGHIPDAEIRAALANSLAATTGADGAYELEIPEAEDPGSIVVAGGGYETQVKEVAESVEEEAPIADAPPDFAAAPREFEVSFVLEPGGAISGRVLDRETRAPAAGMIVLASVFEPEASPVVAFFQSGAPLAVVGADGAYALQGLRLGEYRVWLHSGDSEYLSVRVPRWQDGRSVVLEKGIEAAGVDFLVSRGGTIFGVVSGPDQQALADVSVEVRLAEITPEALQDDDRMSELIRTGDDGAYKFHALLLDRQYRIWAEKEGFAEWASEAVALSAEHPRAEVNLLLTEGCRVSGLVLHPDGAVAPGATVYLTYSYPELRAGDKEAKETVADETGAFTFEGLGAGERRLSVSPPWSFGSRSRERTKSVSLDGVTDVTGVVLIMEKTAGETVLAGVVLDTLGAPIEDAEVWVWCPRESASAPLSERRPARTNAEGQFVLNGLEGQSLTLKASKPGYSSATAPDVPAGAQTVELRLAKHGRISGRVVTGAGEAPGVVGKVFARSTGETSLPESVKILQAEFVHNMRGQDTAEVGEDGNYSVSAPVGKAVVEATVPGFAPGRSDTIEVAAGQDYQGVKIVVTAGAAVRGRVTLGDGAPVEGATIRVELKGGDGGIALLKEMLGLAGARLHVDANAPEGLSDADGGFLVEHLAEGEYLVSAVHDEFAPSEAVPVALSRDQVSAPITLVLRRGGVIEGVATEGGAPKWPVVVLIVSVSAGKKDCEFDKSGKFRFENLAPGRHKVVVIDPERGENLVMKTRTVAVEDGQTVGIEIEFGKGFKVFGKVKGLPARSTAALIVRRPGGPPPDGRFFLNPLPYIVGASEVTQDDTYEIADLDPGTYILEATMGPVIHQLVEYPRRGDELFYALMEGWKPLYRAEITVQDRDLRHDVEIR
ncbi:MAG TPA: carboxypeptidase-like regulatory domain-containing protein [Planctomycetota bacterium]|nr:carboxypeptidase-like regulatory domain-containing protein [Planctomycetota bacterium]HOR67355.1 carboxypeptidase-like regulatory domain-containing protein [Planctomycetota bacterium]HPY70678.1 carboxypeptidase-like regulatory domain-containing protein [Planctomycetota bacterium]HQG86228.1 carboxypeptidase-like regulatory domain-containing protein [Planctomycetota bacterium]HQM60781.1 carboxypeptidase-like regulatory domain-containing protein [Planctomycetota bacterium]